MKFVKHFACCNALVVLLGVAHAAEMPKDIIGDWCFVSRDKYRQCKHPEFVIKRKSTASEHSQCEITDVRKSGDSWIVKKRCQDISPESGNPVSAETRDEIFHYTRKGVYLYVK
jgi:hypothetical protein